VSSLAKAFDAEVLIFCVSRTNTEETRHKLASYGAQVKKQLEGEGIHTSFAESYGNNLAEDCIKFAGIENCDLIAIMTETENTNSFFMGSYAQQLISTSPVPVMSVHARSTKIPQSLS
jgi:nucleotide-binding universal stress UspA family protein